MKIIIAIFHESCSSKYLLAKILQTHKFSSKRTEKLLYIPSLSMISTDAGLPTETLGTFDVKNTVNFSLSSNNSSSVILISTYLGPLSPGKNVTGTDILE